jgi:hypothetical protein
LFEGQIITTYGHVQLVAFEADGDLHVQLVDNPGDKTCFIVEIPDPTYVEAGIAARVKAARAAVLQAVGKPKLQLGGVVAPLEMPFVTVTGQLFFDDAHIGGAKRGKRGVKAGTLFELHPVLDVVWLHTGQTAQPVRR